MLLLTLHFPINRLGDVDSTPFVNASQAGQQPAGINESSLMDESPVPQEVQLDIEVTCTVVPNGSSKDANVLYDSNGYCYTLNPTKSKSHYWRCIVRSKTSYYKAMIFETACSYRPGMHGHLHAPQLDASVACVISLLHPDVRAKNTLLQGRLT